MDKLFVYRGQPVNWQSDAKKAKRLYSYTACSLPPTPTPPPSPCKGILDSGFWILDSTPWIPDSRYSIPFFFSVTWIPGSIVSGIPDSKAQDTGLHNQNFHRLRIPRQGALANEYGDVNENGKKAIGSDWQNNYTARASRFFVHFFAVTARIRRENV